MANSYGNQASSSTPASVFASITGSDQSPTTVAIKALSTNSAPVYLGWDSSVATTTGFPLAAGESVAFDLKGTDEIFVVSAAAQNVRYISHNK